MISPIRWDHYLSCAIVRHALLSCCHAGTWRSDARRRSRDAIRPAVSSRSGNCNATQAKGEPDPSGGLRGDVADGSRAAILAASKSRQLWLKKETWERPVPFCFNHAHLLEKPFDVGKPLKGLLHALHRWVLAVL